MSVGRLICKLYPFLFLSNKKFSWFMKFPDIAHFCCHIYDYIGGIKNFKCVYNYFQKYFGFSVLYFLICRCGYLTCRPFPAVSYKTSHWEPFSE